VKMSEAVSTMIRKFCDVFGVFWTSSTYLSLLIDQPIIRYQNRTEHVGSTKRSSHSASYHCYVS
jgi:tRNA(His) 5'-end guanylyltransferase